MRQAHPVTLAGIPLLVSEPDPSGAPLPVVFWCHGFRADALAHAAELERCAARGFLAVGIDAPEHGARRRDDLAQRVAAAPMGGLPVMLDLAMHAAAELPVLIDALAAAYPVARDRIGLVGISMGAFEAYHAIASGVSLRSVVALLGAPEWPHAASPHRRPEPFRDVALLSITAGDDEHVPPGPARRFHIALARRYPDSRHRYHELPDARHLTTGREWDAAMAETMQWLSETV